MSVQPRTCRSPGVRGPACYDPGGSGPRMASQPERIDRYEIKSPLGGGGMGTLYLAQDPNTGRLVALKLLRTSIDSSELRARFQREVQALGALNHQNVVTIYDSGEFRGSPFMVMEYVRGESLAEKLARRAEVPLGQKLKWLVELCAGLSHAHAAGIIHRDIKPANLMVDRQDRLKIVDFGIARVTESLGRSDVQVTQMHVQIGTPGYMAPEQMRGTGIDHRCDLFAVGAVAYELLSGREAFEGRSAVEVQQKVLRGQAPPLLSVASDLPPGIAAAVHRALEHDPAGRFQDAASLGAVLERERATLGHAADIVAPPAPGPSAPPRGTRADDAFRKSLAALDAGAPGAARRHALEALAEEPRHVGARTVLNEIDGRRPGPIPRAAPPPAPGARVAPAPPPAPPVPTRREASPVVAEGKTVIMKRPDLPLARPAPPRPPADEPRTVAAAAPRPAPLPPAPPPVRHAPPLPPPPPAMAGPHDATVIVPRQPPAAVGAASPYLLTPRRRWARDLRLLLPGPLTPRQRMAAGVAALFVVAAVVGLVLWSPWATRYRVVLQAAEGGTLVGAGLVCGADGSDCTTDVKAGSALSFDAHADPGYVFVGYTGDCARGGRLEVRAAARCGATFERIERQSGPAASGNDAMLLTIVPPDRATVVGQNIECGGGKKLCDAQFAPNTTIVLQAAGIGGATVVGFTGDCDTSGRVVMTGPKTCAVQIRGDGPIKIANSPVEGGNGPPPVPPPPGNSTKPADPRRSAPAQNPGGAPNTPPADPGVGGGGGDGRAGTGSGGGGDKPTTTPAGNDPNAAAIKGPIISFEDAARARIKEMLDKYLAAYNTLSYSDLRGVYVNAPDAIRQQLAKYRSMEYSFVGEPKLVSLAADAGSGTAVIQVGYKQVIQADIGKPQTTQGTIEFAAHRAPSNDWVITRATPKAKAP